MLGEISLSVEKCELRRPQHLTSAQTWTWIQMFQTVCMKWPNNYRRFMILCFQFRILIGPIRDNFGYFWFHVQPGDQLRQTPSPSIKQEGHWSGDVDPDVSVKWVLVLFRLSDLGQRQILVCKHNLINNLHLSLTSPWRRRPPGVQAETASLINEGWIKSVCPPDVSDWCDVVFLLCHNNDSLSLSVHMVSGCRTPGGLCIYSWDPLKV